ncbi:aldehyde dehydrogenase family protein [Pseudonocardia hispaniensis]|uniref:Aldehyde dehydrogenase family protein n=1 Tax=Pseudonocardia hispaniensis TaxID=904933 RepID=A0ABW1J6E1_9PSEU
MTIARYDQNFIGGRWVRSSGSELIDVVDASTGRVIAKGPAGTEADVDAAVAEATAALPSWRALSPGERAVYLRAIADGLEARREELARTITSEVGCPIGLSRTLQCVTPVHSFRTAAAIATSYPFERVLDNSHVVREPMGVVGAITAWNFPLHLVTVKSAFALAAGNTVVVKPSEVAPLTAVILGQIVAEAGLPAGVFNVVFGTGPEVGEAIVRHPDVAMVSFTGSTRAGRRIGELAADQIKKVTLELGGKSPSLVLEDADLEAAVVSTVDDCLINNGQRCDALTRLLVPRRRLAEAEQIAAERASKAVVGNPLDPATQVGPVVSAVQRDRIVALIRSGIDEGAKLVAGGPDAPELDADLATGFFVTPTVFSEVTATMRIAQEEIFGPVLAIQPYDSADEAIELANDTVYGLHAAVWSADESDAMRVAGQIQAGMVRINDGAFNPLAPFGGYKQSGLGREFGEWGFEEFLEVKSMQTSANSRPWM